MIGEAKLTKWHRTHAKYQKEFHARTVRIFAREMPFKNWASLPPLVRITLVDEPSKEFIDIDWFTAICLGVELQTLGEQMKKKAESK